MPCNICLSQRLPAGIYSAGSFWTRKAFRNPLPSRIQRNLNFSRQYHSHRKHGCQPLCIFRKELSLSSKTGSLSTLSGNQSKPLHILGIETSCDDTGAAVVDSDGNVIGEALNSQTIIHNRTGGIIPNVAKELHAKNVEQVVQDAMDAANMTLAELDGIAVTTEPGLIMSLRVGLEHAQKLAEENRKGVIPIHHMEAHALTARMIHKIPFPYLVLLASGGHCLLAVVRDVHDFLLLGSSLDVAPGEAFDKTARELSLFELPEFSNRSGGVAIEQLAQKGDSQAFPQIHVMTSRANCNFSFSGLKLAAKRKIMAEYERQGLPPYEMLPNVADICAWFQLNVTYHLARRVQRALIYCEMTEILGREKTMVMSGGVASNCYIRDSLEQVCGQHGCHLVCPPQRLCTDNGIMIAWNGMEKLLSGRSYFQSPETLDVRARSPLGQDISKEVTNTSIKLPKLRLQTR